MQKEKKPGSWRIGGCYGGVLGIHSFAENYNLDINLIRFIFFAYLYFKLTMVKQA